MRHILKNRTSGLWVVTVLAFVALVWVAISVAAQPANHMRAFASESELKAFLAKREKQGRVLYDIAPPPMAAPPSIDLPSVAADAGAVAADASADAASEPPPEEKAEESITNTQTAGVDEGGIVKKQGDLLVVLRRGRLFTIDTAGGDMRPVANIDVFPGKNEPDGTWYDEMLVSNDTIIVLGYSYERSGTEVNRFSLSPEGRLAWRDTHYLRSGDYYSSRNYASRLIGDKLIFYAPLETYGGFDEALPALAPLEKGGKVGRFKPFAGPREIYMPQPAWSNHDLAGEVLHSVMICELGRGDMDCRASNVIGGWSHSFYVSQQAVYIWAEMGSDYDNDNDNRSMLYRIPLDGGAPQAVEVAGMPLDQFSFREESDGTLHVLTMAEGGGDGMWAAEANDKGDMALLRLAASRFGDGRDKVEPKDYRTLPGVEGYERQNRFVGDWLLYAGGETYRDLRKGEAKTPPLYAVPVNGGAVVPLDPGHNVGRIDIMGRDAIIVGSGQRNALVFSTIALDGTARLASRFAFPSAAEGENRSHAFFYRAEPGGNGDDGLLGLPVMRSGDGGTKFLGGAASILYLKRAKRDLALAGTLDAKPGGRDDNCLASCVDWYGNARPVFFGSRIFALMGYELVEGHWEGGSVREKARVDFTPVRPPVRRM
jgi:hypothetical protein